MFARFNGTMTESESSNTYIAGYEHSFFPSRPGLCVLGMLEASQVPWVDVRTCMGSWTPRSLTALTNTDGLVLPSTTGTVSALRKSSISSLISPAHAHRYRRFAHPLAGTDARLAAKVARYTFLSAGLAPAVHARVSLAHPRTKPSDDGMIRDSGSVKFTWSFGCGPGYGSCGGRPPGFRPDAASFAARAAIFSS